MWRLMENIIEEDDLKSLIKFLEKAERFTNGPKVSEFEDKWSRWLGTSSSVMVNSGASGNFLSIALVKELFGTGEIIVPCLGWSSDVSSVVQLGMTPVFVDVDPKTLGINPKSLREAITDKTKAIVIVHALGFNAISEELKLVLDDLDVFVIEDCCESHGALIDLPAGQKIGTYGDLSIFSFYFGHHITTIEGGMVSTNDERIYQLSRMFRSHGMTREASQDIRDEYVDNYPDLNPLFTFAVPGFNFRSSELNAVLGLSQLKKLDRNIEIRKRNLDIWLDSLCKTKFETDYAVDGNSNFALPLIQRQPDVDLKSRICKSLENNNVEYRLGTAGGGNLARQPFVKKYPYRTVDDQAVVNHIHDFGLYLGNGAHVTPEQIRRVAEELSSI